MELQFHKTNMGCLQPAAREVQTQEQTQEVRLTDGMPDIGNVLGAWGQVILRGKEWRSGGMGVSCGVMVWVLYAPEEGGDPRSVEAWIPFQLKWDLPDTDRDGTICVQPLLKSVDARSVSARKLMVRACVSAMGEAMVPGQVAVYTPGEVPEDVQLLQRSYPVCLPREAGEKPFLMEENLSIPNAGPKAEKIIRFSLRPELVELRVMAEKLVFRGIAILHVLYRSQDGQLYSCDFDLPFSQYSELEREYDTDASASVIPAVTSLELDMDEEGSLRLKAGLTGQYVIYDRPLVEVVEDAYSLRRRVGMQQEALQMPMVLDTHRETIHAEEASEVQGTRIADMAFYPDQPRVLREDAGVTLQMPGQFQMLYYDMDGNLQGTAPRWDGQWQLGADPDARVEAMAWPTGKPQGSFGGGNAVLRADVVADTKTCAQQGIPMVTALELGEMTEADPNRPSLILRRAGEDDLWKLAKRCGSTVDAIRKANDLADEPAADSILLIPVS